MKIIDLLNKIANGEEVPKKIKYKDNIFYYDEQVKDYFDCDNTYYFIDDYVRNKYGITRCLDDEVEILDDNKKIEKIKYEVRMGRLLDEAIIDKINELIDCINKEQE